MDISFVTDEGKFNYRACAIIISDGRILAMHDERSPYYYLPGGKVKMGETAEKAIKRELREELEIDENSESVSYRPLWFNQSFFREDVDGLNYHELCVYFLADISKPKIFPKGDKFVLSEGKHIHTFKWLPFESLEKEYFYPLFLKKKIFDLPKSPEFLVTRE